LGNREGYLVGIRRPSTYSYPPKFNKLEDADNWAKRLYAELLENDSRGEEITARATDKDLKELIVRPEWYGAKGDGVHDDTAAIQAAMGAAHVSGGGNVLFSGKNYLISNYINVYSNTHVSGIGYKSKIFSSTFDLGDIAAEGGSGSSISATLYAVSGESNIEFSGLRVVGASVAYSTGDSFGILLGLGTSGCRVHDCFVEKVGWSGVLARGSGHEIYHNYCANCPVDGIEVWGSQILVRDNYTTGNGFMAGGYQAGIEVMADPNGDSPDIASYDVSVIGNTSRADNQGFVSQYGKVHGLIISGNTYSGLSGRGIDFNGGASCDHHDVIISGNVLRGPFGSGAYGNGITIANNMSDFIVANNTISGLVDSANAIYVADNATRINIKGNLILGNWVGLNIGGTANDIYIHDNILSGNIAIPFYNTSTGNVVVGQNCGINDNASGLNATDNLAIKNIAIDDVGSAYIPYRTAQTEILLDGGLETWASATNLTNWAEYPTGSSTVNQESTTIHGGTYTCRLDVDSLNSPVSILQFFSLSASAAYKISLWYQTAADKTARLDFRDDSDTVFLKSDGTWTTISTYIVLPASVAWKKYALYFTSHASYTAYRITLQNQAGASSSMYFDDVSVALAGVLADSPLSTDGTDVDNSGVYKVDAVQVVGNRVVDARLADTPNSGNATTDGLIDALRDLILSHGLGASS
jgi:hypothetical protein